MSADAVAHLRPLAKPFVAPISEATPGGLPARNALEFDRLAAELGKLESPTGGAVDWEQVVQAASSILQRSSKDLLVAAQLAYAQLVTRGLDGLLLGSVLLWELLDGYWETMHPDLKRLRGRANALGWFVAKTAAGLEGLPVSPAHRQALVELKGVVGALSTLARQRLEAMTPAFSPLVEQIDRLLLSLPEPAAPPAPAPIAAPPAPVALPLAAPAPPAAVAPPVAVAPPAAAPPAPPPPAAPPEAPRPAPAAAPPAAAEAPSGAAPALARPQRAEEVPDFLDQVADGLVESARLLREAQPGDPMAAHLVRVGAWLRLLEAPEADAGGTTGVRPLPFSVQGELDDARAAGQWTQVARLAESAVAAYPLAFDLHRQALEAFGEMGARGAKEVVAGSLAALLARLPRLRTLRAVDGTPLLPDETRAALAREGFGAGDGAPAVPGDGAQQGLLEEAARLASGGEVPQAMAQLQAALAGARDARARFRLRLAMADLCRTSGRLPTARALYEILDRDGGAPEPGAPAPVAPWPGPWLDEWDQELASAFLSGYLLCLRALREAGQEIDARREAYVYQRLCRVDSSAALRLE